MECNCFECIRFRAPAATLVAEDTARRRSRRLAAKPAVNYYEAPVVPEHIQRRRDKRAYELRGGLTWNQFVAAVRAECDCTWAEAMEEASRRMKGEAPRSAADFAESRMERLATRAAIIQIKAEETARRQDERKRRRAEQIIARLERDLAALDSMPTTPPRLARQAAIVGAPSKPAISRTLSPPPPLRRTCQLPGCDEHCSYCRENDRIAAYNRANPIIGSGQASIPRIRIPAWADEEDAIGIPPLPFLPSPPPIGATVIRVPIDMTQMTTLALQELIAAAQRALANK